ncbi:hypothetical protein MRB53_006033 [Persea americana]|uniref:Uncharacterized protein n=1 Tax=Persea americana TaxID=3435 RepID=A0ACC2MFQ4_PERAE|nr:hypothetical protein MRB53_006033 [Persea americana]
MEVSNVITPTARTCTGEGVPSIPPSFGDPCCDLLLSSFGSNSPAALHLLSVAVGVLRSFLDVAHQSPLSELAEELAYYEGIAASPL